MTNFPIPIEKALLMYYNIQCISNTPIGKENEMKRIITMVLCLVLITAALAGCKKVISSGTTDPVSPAATTAQSDNNTESEAASVNYQSKSTEALISFDDVPAQNLDIDTEYQYADPKDGEDIAIIHTNYGDIYMKFFPEVAPMAVESFKALAKAGRYDDTIFHRVINNFMIQGGDYTNFNGTGGESAFGEEFDLEISDYLHNTEGAVAMANRGPGTNGSQFYINQVDNNYLDGNYTVFGQVYDGMDVVNDIAQVETNYNDRPLNDVIIESIEITTY